MNKVLMSGNDAVVEGAIRAGLDCYFGYPITPQNEIIGGMAARLPPLGRVFLQSESELAAVSMVQGAAAAGKRGHDHLVEPRHLAHAGRHQLHVRRAGAGGDRQRAARRAGVGQHRRGQGDYFQATRGGGNGDYRNIVLAPASAQEMLDFTFEAFDLADQYRMPVMVLADGRLGQTMEPVELRDPPAQKRRPKPWALTGAEGRAPNYVRSFHLPPPDLAEHNRQLQKVYREIERREPRAESYDAADAALVFVAYGTCARLCREAVALLRDEGLEGRHVPPDHALAVPEQELQSAVKKAKRVVVVELSAGQMIDDVRLALADRVPIEFVGRMGGEASSVKELVALGRKFLGKKGRPQ